MVARLNQKDAPMPTLPFARSLISRALRQSSLAALVGGVLLATVPVAMAAAPAAVTGLELNLLGRYSTGLYDQGGAEIPAYDPASRRLFVVNLANRAVDVIDITDPTQPTKVGALDMAVLGQAANSVSAKNGIVAVAVEAVTKTDPGLVAFYRADTLALVSTAQVGALPDMLTWTPDGTRVLVANEGEPNDDYSVDPEGSVSIVDVSDVAAPRVRTVDFRRFNSASQRSRLLAAGVRLYGPNASTAQDLEPEYITTTNTTAWVTLQENNAIARINLANASVAHLYALGAKDHSVTGQGLDPSDKDGANIGTWPVWGLYQPDAIGHFNVGGQRYLVTANEGDTREYAGLNEGKRVKDLALDPSAFPNAAALKTDAQIGRLNVTNQLGDTDGDGDFDRLYSFGARSISVWTDRGQLVWDSGDQIEQAVLAKYPSNFNAGHTTNARDDRSDNKGPEPEGLVVARLYNKPWAFVGLERIGGVMVWDLSTPTAPTLVSYTNTRDFTATTSTAAAGDLGPEGLLLIQPADSPNGKPLLVVANEVSGTTAILQITPKR